jgi:hypothetical protein
MKFRTNPTEATGRIDGTAVPARQIFRIADHPELCDEAVTDFERCHGDRHAIALHPQTCLAIDVHHGGVDVSLPAPNSGEISDDSVGPDYGPQGRTHRSSTVVRHGDGRIR